MSIVALVGIALIVTVAGMFFLFQSNISEAPEKSPKPDYSEFTLDQELLSSNERISQVRDDFYNGQYNGDLDIQDAIKIIENEIKVQKQLYDDYKKLPPEMQTNLQIAQKFNTIGKYWFASEESILSSMYNQMEEEI